MRRLIERCVWWLVVLAWIWCFMAYGFEGIITEVKWKSINLLIVAAIFGIGYGVFVLISHLLRKKKQETKLSKNANDNFLDKNDGV